MNLIFRPVKMAAIMWFVIATVLFCLPGSAFPEVGWGAVIGLDKWVHMGIFFLLYYLWFHALTTWNGRKDLVLFAVLIVYGCLIEVIQDRLVVNRSFDVFDIVADSIGAAIAVGFVRYIKK